MKKKIIIFLFLIFSVSIVKSADVIVVEPELYLSNYKTPIDITPLPLLFSGNVTFENPNNIDENITYLSISTPDPNIIFQSITPTTPIIIDNNSNLTFNYDLNVSIQQKKFTFGTSYWTSYTNYNYIYSSGQKYYIRFLFNITATIDYAYLPSNPQTKTFLRNLTLIHYCDSSYHPSQLLNLSGTLYICSDNCTGNYQWNPGYYPKITNIVATPTNVDRTKDAPITDNTVAISFFVSDKNGKCNIQEIYITLYAPSGTKVIDIDISSSCTDYNSTTKRCIYHWTPHSSSELGDYDVTLEVIDREGLSESKTINDLFEVRDLEVTITKFYGNTTDFYIEGNAKLLPEYSNINNVLAGIYCGYPLPGHLGGSLEPCGRLRNCNLLGGGNFSCYINDLKLTNNITNISFIITTNIFGNISGYKNEIIILDGKVNSIKLSDSDYVNIYQPIYYIINFSNIGNIGWYGKIFNQTRIKVFSLPDENPANILHISLDYSSPDSYVDLANGTTSEESHFLGNAYYVLGAYNYTLNFSYFWPNYPSRIFNFTILSKIGKINFSVGAIDITDYEVPEEIIRGDLIIGRVQGYFVGSMDIDKWETIQGFKWKVTNSTTTGKFWITKINLSSSDETFVYGSESNPKNMEWNGETSYWEAKINSFDLTCDYEDTIHRLYFLINWTDYNIYTPYIRGSFNLSYWPYFYQDFKVTCIARALYEINPTTVNLPLGAENKDIFKISIENPANHSITVDISLTAKNYKDIINWLSFATSSGNCGADCINTTLFIDRESGNSTNVILSEANRAGTYELEFIIKDSNGRELFRKRVWLNIFSQAIGNNSILYLILLFSFVCILLIRKL